MGKELDAAFPEAAAVFDEVSDTLGRSARTLCFDLDEDTLRQTENAQLALFTAGVAAYRALAARAPQPVALAGHSVGEYAALVASGTLSLADGARLIERRGQLMAAAPMGAMSAVLGLEREALEAVCAATPGIVVIANDNCPGQLVISGDRDAVPVAGATAQEKGAKRVLPLNVSGAFHSPLMQVAAEAMAETLATVTWHPQAIPVTANVTAQAETGNWASLLSRQLASPVRWTESVQAMIASGVTLFVECGCGEVLTGLLKRIDRGATGVAAQDPASLEAAVAALQGVPA